MTTPTPDPDLGELSAGGAVAPLLLRPMQAAQALNVGRSTIFKLISTGALRSITIERLRLVPVSEIHRFIADALERQDGDTP